MSSNTRVLLSPFAFPLVAVAQASFFCGFWLLFLAGVHEEKQTPLSENESKDSFHEATLSNLFDMRGRRISRV